YSRQEFLQMSILDIRPEEDVKEVKSVLQSNNDEAIHGKVWHHQKKCGEVIYVKIRCRDLKHSGSNACLVLAEDVTDTILAEEKYRMLFQNIPLPAWIYSSNDLSFLEVNDAAVEHYGYARQEFLKMNLLDLHLPQDYDQVKESIKISKSKAKSVVTTWTHVRKNGEKIIIEANRKPMLYQGMEVRLVVIKDITENVKAEERLKESNNRFTYVAQATSDVIWDWNLADQQILWSENYEKKFGWKLPADKTTAVTDLQDKIHPDDVSKLLASIQKVVDDSSRKVWVDEFRLKKSDGSYAYVKNKGVILRNNDKKAIRLLGVLHDITDRKIKENQLLQVNKRYQFATRATSDVIYDWELVSDVLEWSESIQNVFGWKKEEVSIEKWEGLIHEDDRPQVMTTLKNFIKSTQNLWKAEYRFRKKDGNYSYVLDRAFIVRDEENKPVRLIGAMQDITEMKLKESELAKSNERFQIAVSATSDIVWDWDFKLNKVLWSDKYQQIMGWLLPPDRYVDAEECVNKFHPEDRERVRSKLNAVLMDKTKAIWEDEFRYKRADGTYAYVNDRGFILRDRDGVAERIIGAVQDISDRKYEEELQKLELRVFELSAIPGIDFTTVLKTLTSGYEQLNAGVFASICLLGSNEELQIVAPKLSREHCRQLRYFTEKLKNRLVANASTQEQFVSSAVDGEDWKYGMDLANFYHWKVSWTMPLYHKSEELLGFITVFVDTMREPSVREHHTLARLRNLLRILIVNQLSLEQIRMSTERYENVMKATHDMVWDWNLETGIFYRSKEGVRKVYGMEDVESIASVYSWMERIHPNDHVKVQNVINNILHATEENTFDVEYMFKRDDGGYSSIYDRGIIIRNKEGKPVRMIGAAQNITDRKKLEQELLQQELDKQKLISRATIDTQEEERREIGKELHDNVNQVLTTTKLYLDLSLSSPEMKDELIKKSSKNVIYVINEIRQLSRSLMDPSIGDLGLIDSINDLVDNINMTRKLHVSLNANSAIEKVLDENQKLMIFRIIQESMNNIIKYAQATSVQVNIKKNANSVELFLADDGVGFDPETVKKGAGLKNIQNRVYLTNGNLIIDSAPGKGCKIIINLPLNTIQ
ncbi:MAG TPA: PAS domain-containing protein, partial [Chitinophagaceae bacterium]|nr:PAS domain-containing protein [Chitinophagaceae bacterium]